MKKNEVISVPEAQSLFSSPEEVELVERLLAYLDNPEETESKVVSSKERIRALHQRMDEMNKKLAKLKALIETVLFDIYAGDRGPELETEFKFQAPRTTIKSIDNGELMTIALCEGINAQTFANACSPITAKTFGELLGYTQEAVMKNYWKYFTTEKSKPVLKRVYNY